MVTIKKKKYNLLDKFCLNLDFRVVQNGEFYLMNPVSLQNTYFVTPHFEAFNIPFAFIFFFKLKYLHI